MNYINNSYNAGEENTLVKLSVQKSSQKVSTYSKEKDLVYFMKGRCYAQMRGNFAPKAISV